MTILMIFFCPKILESSELFKKKGAPVRRQNWGLILAFCDLNPVTCSLDLSVHQLQRTEMTLSRWVLSGHISSAGKDFCVTKADGRWVGSERLLGDG